MAENKFKIRIWDKIRKEMIYEGGRSVDFKTSIGLLGCEINGTMVYDGDLLESVGECDGEIVTSKIPVVFENGAFWVDESFHKDGTYLHLLCEWDEKIKVIGNIYENN